MNLVRVTAALSALGTMAFLSGPVVAKGNHFPYEPEGYFQRIATFPVFLNTDIAEETVSEILDVSKNGKTLVYTDAKQELVGFVDINDPSKPKAAGTVPVGGEPTSVAVAGPYALAAVNSSGGDFEHPSGHLRVINISSHKVVTDIDLGGQPDSTAISPDGQYAAIAIENERDEDLGDGYPPQMPAGYLMIVDLKGHPKHWKTRKVELTGLADKFPDDPEPEYVDINSQNIAVVTLQENNHIVLVDLKTGDVIKHFSAGTVDLDQIDTNENDLVELKDGLSNVPREPDGVTWLNDSLFATADEGDLDGGTRGVTIFDTDGLLVFSSGNSNDHIAVRVGHYPENRSENKGNETENVEYARFGKDDFLFAASERSSIIYVYRLDDEMQPEFLQVLPAALGPEGIKAIPKRGLFVAASEEDSRDDKFRSALTIYKLSDEPTYPTLESADRPDGTPIPWGAQSALAYNGGNDYLYSVYDSFYRKSRIFRIDHRVKPALIDEEIVLVDSSGVLAGESSIDYTQTDEEGNEESKSFAFADLINDDDGTVNLDPEGLTIAQDGSSFWLASEGSGNLVNGVSDAEDRPFNFPNLLLKVADDDGAITEVVRLPETLEMNQLRFGFEGVASVEEDGKEILYAAFQREWKAAGDPSKYVRIGRYDITAGAWTFAYYEIDEPTSPVGGWVGLSEIAALGGGQFAVIERDNQAGSDARIKKIYQFSISGKNFLETPDENESSNVIAADEKVLARDLIADGDLTRLNGQIIEKVEGMAALPDGSAFIVTDNDGVDDSRGETQFLELPPVLH